MTRLTRLGERLARLDRRQVAGGAAALAAAAVLLVLLLITVCGGESAARPIPSPTPTPTPTPTPIPTPTPLPSEATLIDGVLVYPEDLARLQQRLPLAIILENHVQARPPVGLERAELVYEAIAEGGITRFLAVYWRNDVELIEPVRSARVYYLDWAKELDAVFVHHGFAEEPGPANVPAAIARLGIRDLDGFFLGSGVGERDPARPSPHNVLTDTARLWETALRFGYVGPPALQAWQFKDGQPERASDPAFRAAPLIDISFGGGFATSYWVRWQYDGPTNAYHRSNGGAAHVDAASGRQLTARNVAVQFTAMRSAGDGTAHLLFDTIGEGEAVVFQDGVAIEGTWRKPDAASRTRFYDAAGNEIAFVRGQTWVEIVPVGYPVQY